MGRDILDYRNQHYITNRNYTYFTSPGQWGYSKLSMRARKIGKAWTIWWCNDDVSATIFLQPGRNGVRYIVITYTILYRQLTWPPKGWSPPPPTENTASDYHHHITVTTITTRSDGLVPRSSQLFSIAQWKTGDGLVYQVIWAVSYVGRRSVKIAHMGVTSAVPGMYTYTKCIL